MTERDETGLTILEGKLFGPGETVVLDGHRFRQCKFLSCMIQYSGDFYVLDDCEIEGNVVWRFGGSAQRSLNLFRYLCDTQPETRSELIPLWQTWTRGGERIQ